MMWYVWALAAAFALVIILLIIGSAVFFRMIVARSKEEGDKKSLWDREDEPVTNPKCIPFAKEITEGRRYVRERISEKFEITSYDGLRLSARLAPADSQRAIVLMMHGYRSDPLYDFSCAVRPYNERGFSCVLPFERAHGESEGKYICFGTKEKYDVVSWCKFLEEKYPGVPVILDGISMGATTVLMASGLELPSNVKGIVADCGFTSPLEIYKTVCRASFAMSPFPFVYTTSLAIRLVAGFNVRESTLKALKKNSLPVFFAHGEADKFVPCRMSADNYEAALKYCDAEFFSVPEAEHGLSFLVDNEGYLKALDKFLDKCIK